MQSRLFAELFTDTTSIGGTTCLYMEGMFFPLPFPILAVSVSKISKTTLQWSPSSSMGFTIQLAVERILMVLQRKMLRFFLLYVLRIVRPLKCTVFKD